MATEFLLPDIGEGLTEVEIVRWMVEVGDEIGLDQPLVEVETAKAVVEIPAPRAGVVLHLGGAVGETIDVGAVLAVIGDADEQWPLDGGRSDSHGAEQTAEAAPLVGTLSETAENLPTRAAFAGAEPGTAPKALPIVRKLAREAGVDLADVRGTGPSGRITRDDLDAHLHDDGGAGKPTTAGGEMPAGTPDSERRRMSMLRRTIARHMTRSWSEIPHVTTFDQADATRLLEVRSALADRHGAPLPLEALVAKAAIPVVLEFDVFNASIDGEDIIVHSSVDLGIAVDTDDGLLVPVVRSAEALGLRELADAVVDLGSRGRTRTLTPDELTGATFTISNIGAVGGGFGTPIVPHGTTAILSVGRAVDQPVVRGGAVAIAPRMPLSLSFDHRVIDGGMGRRFMARLLENLAEPALFLS